MTCSMRSGSTDKTVALAQAAQLPRHRSPTAPQREAQEPQPNAPLPARTRSPTSGSPALRSAMYLVRRRQTQLSALLGEVMLLCIDQGAADAWR
jgi:hypothetical protein